MVVPDRALLDTLRNVSVPAVKRADHAFLEKLTLQGNAAFSFDVDALPEPFPAPALFLLGRQDNVVGYRDAWDVVENYPRATFAVLDRAGHFLNYN
jgi:pimeloyl-ACP methyl ester carboxylesterase